MKDRIYLDYNATSPLAKNVTDFLAQGDLSFLNANPASAHSSGKKSAKSISEVTEFLLSTFRFNNSHNVLYHSGATEAINTFFRLSNKDIMIYSESDHPCVKAMAEYNDEIGVETHCLIVNEFGEIDLVVLESILKDCSKNILLNITLVNNETGYITDIKPIIDLKKRYSFILHVDAVQSIARFEGWNELSSEIDIITYSAHKFGALKGVGFSLIQNGFQFKPLIIGGGQQESLRSGTQNPLGVYSIKLALEEVIENHSIKESLKLKNDIIDLFNSVVGDSGMVLLSSSNQIACNTIGLIFKKFKSDISLIHFDMQSIDVSFGSACSSGSIEANQSLASLGVSKYSKNFIRLSFGPLDYINRKDILTRLESVFKRLI